MKIKNGAARNSMSEFERQCYDWGWQDAEAEILNMLNDLVDKLEAMRPESYKKVADKMDFRIRVLRNVIKKIEDAEPTEKIEEMSE